MLPCYEIVSEAKNLESDRLRKLDRRMRWIPVADAVPDPAINHGYVLVCRNGEVTTANYGGFGKGTWSVHDRDDETTPPSHWMPLPEPVKVE
jgi:hypothetical protein